MEYSFGSAELFSVVITVLVLGKHQLVVGVDSDSVELITGEAEVCTYVYVCVCEWSEKSALGLITTQLFSKLICLSTPLTNFSAWALLSLCTATELQSIDEYTLASACITCTTHTACQYFCEYL